MHNIITISREYGSGGRDVGRMLADQLSVPVYDKEIMHMAAERSGLPVDYVEKKAEKVKTPFWQNLQRLSLNVPNVRIHSGYNSLAVAKAMMSNTTEVKNDADRLFHAQAEVVREIATKGGCVIIGRCAGYILRDHPLLLSVFVRSLFEDRVNRAIKTYNYTEKTAAADVQKVDKHRANYYQYYTKQTWGAASNYDLVINTSRTGIKGAVEIIKSMVNVIQT